MSPVVQRFTINAPEGAAGRIEEGEWILDRPDAESLFHDLGVSLYGENFRTQQEPVQQASWDMRAVLEMLGGLQIPTQEQFEESLAPAGQTVSTEELAAQKQALAAVEEQARREVRSEHTASPHQPHGSAIGVRPVQA